MSLILKSICWNTNGDPILGSLNCRKDYDTEIEPHCILQDNPNGLIGVFVPQWLGGISITVSIEIYNDDDDAIDAFIIARENNPNPILGDATFVGTKFPGRILTTVLANLSTAHIKRPPFINQLQKQVSTWTWGYSVPVSTTVINIATTTQTLYLLPNTPVATYSNSGTIWDVAPAPYNPLTKNYIWTDLLDICCKACDDYLSILNHRPADDDEHIKAFVYGLNHCSAFHYDIYTGASNYSISYLIYNIVKLKKFVRDYKKPYPNNLNCTDCASIVALEGLACGINAYTVKMASPPPPPPPPLPLGFKCNPIVAIGYATWEVPFDHGFRYHEVTALQANFNATTPIYDACLHLDRNNFPSSVNLADKAAYLPVNYIFAENANPLVNVPIAAAYLNQFYRERLVANGELCSPAGSCYINGFNNMLSAQEAIQMPNDSQELLQIKARYGLGENTLPAGNLHSAWMTAPKITGLDKLGSWTLVDDDERNKGYELLRKDVCFQIQFWFAMDEQEAWLLLLSRLDVVSNPNVERDNLGDIGFRIGEVWRLFVAENILVEVFCETHSVDETATAIVDCLSGKQD